METQIPIYRAKYIKNGKEIIGSHIYSEFEDKHWIRYEMPIRKGFSAPRVMTLEIDPSTLEITHDGGDTWESIEYMSELMRVVDGYDIETIKNALEYLEATGIQE